MSFHDSLGLVASVLMTLLVTSACSRALEVVLRRRGRRNEVDVMEAVNQLEWFRLLKFFGRASAKARNDVMSKSMNLVMGIESEAKARAFLRQLEKAMGSEEPEFIEQARRFVGRRFGGPRKAAVKP